MKISLSLKQTWTALVLFAVIMPATILVIGYSRQIYYDQVSNALIIERQSNELLKLQVESVVKRLQALLHNKSDSLSMLVDKSDDPNTLKDINTVLKTIIKREPSIHEIIVLSKNHDVTAVIEPSAGIMGDRPLSSEELNNIILHWRFYKNSALPELQVPLSGRDYIGSPEKHEDFIAFTLATPIGAPSKATLIALIDINKLWLPEDNPNNPGIKNRQSYIVDQKGVFITQVSGKKISAARTALTSRERPVAKSYIGISGQPVFGIKTNIDLLNWILISEVSTSKITQPIISELLNIFYASLLILIFFMIVAILLARKTLKPIHSACKAIGNVTNGDYNIELEPCSISEFDALNQGFNKMVKVRQRTQSLLREKERDLQAIMDHSPSIIDVKDTNGNFIFINYQFVKLFNRSTDEVIGKNINDIFPKERASQILGC